MGEEAGCPQLSLPNSPCSLVKVEAMPKNPLDPCARGEGSKPSQIFLSQPWTVQRRAGTGEACADTSPYSSQAVLPSPAPSLLPPGQKLSLQES